MQLDPQPFNLKETIEDVTALLANAKQEASIDLLMRYQPGLPSSFVGDAGRIRQVITNILGNAIKFTQGGHVLVDICLLYTSPSPRDGLLSRMPSSA